MSQENLPSSSHADKEKVLAISLAHASEETKQKINEELAHAQDRFFADLLHKLQDGEEIHPEHNSVWDSYLEYLARHYPELVAKKEYDESKLELSTLHASEETIKQLKQEIEIAHKRHDHVKETILEDLITGQHEGLLNDNEEHNADMREIARNHSDLID